MSSLPSPKSAAGAASQAAVWRRWLAAPEASVLFVLVALLGLMASRGILPRFLSEFNHLELAKIFLQFFE